RAESREFQSHGWDVINMTQYPEAYLARELGMCYANIALVTDYDVGLEDDSTVAPVSHEEVMRVFQANVDRVRQLLETMIPALPTDEPDCACASALDAARG